MSYAAAIAKLNALAPELFTQPGRPRRKFSLEEFRTLLAALGNPQHRFPSVLIAGTNGKGSTASTLASILQSAGLRAGLYTSPHLERPSERIRINGAEISDEAFGRFFSAVQDAQKRLLHEGSLPQPASFFEVLTAMAFLACAEAQIDIAVLEVGLGGRLDATNVVEPLISVITDISLDHTEWLGSTITAIAREKAGILRRNGVLVTLPQHPEANQAIGEAAMELNVRGVSATSYMPPVHAPAHRPYTVDVMGTQTEVASPLRGEHQHRNIALAIATAVELAAIGHNDESRVPHPSPGDGWETTNPPQPPIEPQRSPGAPGLDSETGETTNPPRRIFPITPEAIAEGIRNTRWPGRLELLATQSGQWLLDVAHNPAGVWALRAGLSQMFSGEAEGSRTASAGEAAAVAPQVPQVLVFGCLQDKPLFEMAQVLFPLFRQIVFAPIASPRAIAADELIRAAEMTGTPAVAAPTVEAALSTALEFAGGAPVVIAGSVYLVGAARAILLGHASAQGKNQTLGKDRK
jgi:dihydrofolate synthase/folylpolyglutamate synthase